MTIRPVRRDRVTPGDATVFTPAPFRLPPGFLASFGYGGGRRFVALWWEPCGDEACYDDGRVSACGLADNWLFLDLVGRPEVVGWLAERGVALGSSDRGAEHWLVADALTGDVYVAAWRDARLAVVGQHLPGRGAGR